jgi:hypothetical protein
MKYISKYSLIFFGFLLSQNSFCQNPDCVKKNCEKFPILWQHDGLKGSCFIIDSHKEHLFGLHDAASSICVPKGWLIILYEHDNYEGASFRIEGPKTISSLSPYGWNDKASSVKVWAPDER